MDMIIELNILVSYIRNVESNRDRGAADSHLLLRGWNAFQFGLFVFFRCGQFISTFLLYVFRGIVIYTGPYSEWAFVIGLIIAGFQSLVVVSGVGCIISCKGPRYLWAVLMQNRTLNT